MNELELLAELYADILQDLRPEIESMTPAELAWQPGPQANSIGVTLWHIARGMDLLAVRVLQGQAAETELWQTRGWMVRTGYDPRGIGYDGWGVVTGYTWEEVQAIPYLTAGELLEYLQQVVEVLTEQVCHLSPEAAHQPAPGLMNGKLTYYRWIKEFYKGFQAHVGEIVAIKAMYARQNTS